MADHRLKVSIEELVRARSSRVELVQHVDARAEIWRNYRLVILDGKRQPFAVCVKCLKLVSYRAREGTGGLHRHPCSRPGSNMPTGIHPLLALPAAPVAPSSPQSTPLNVAAVRPVNPPGRTSMIPMDERDTLAWHIMKFVCKDIRPTDVVEGEGFVQFAQALVDFGAKYGKHQVADLFEGITAMSRLHLTILYEQVKQGVAQEFMRELDTGAAFTIDQWRDEFRQKTYMTVTAHYISAFFVLNCKVVGTKELPNNNEEAVNMSVIVSDLLSRFLGEAKARDIVKDCTYVMDSRTNFVCIIEDSKCISCACQSLDLVMEEVFSPEVVGSEPVHILLDQLKKVIAIIQKSKMCEKLSALLRSEGAAQWASYYLMTESIQQNWEDFVRTFIERGDTAPHLDLTLVNDLHGFLQPFKEACESLCSDTSPTLNLVILWKLKLEKHCNPNPDDSNAIQALKETALASLGRHFELDSYHYVALFLDPRFKKLKMLSANQREETYNKVKTMISKYQSSAILQIFGNSSDLQYAKKKPNHSITEAFNEFMDSSNEETDEITSYLNMDVYSETQPLDFWRGVSMFPKLQILARHILSIPASSSSHNYFCQVRQAMMDRRRLLQPSDVDKILFLHKNL